MSRFNPINPGQLVEGIFEEVMGGGIPSLLRTQASTPVPASNVATALNRHMAMDAGGYSPMTVPTRVNAGPVTPFRAETINASPYKLTPGNVDKGVSGGAVYRQENFPHGVVPRSNPMGGSEEVLRKQRMTDGGSAVHRAGTTQQELEQELERVRSSQGPYMQTHDPKLKAQEQLSPEQQQRILDANTPEEMQAALSGAALPSQKALAGEMQNRAQSIADMLRHGTADAPGKVESVMAANTRLSNARANVEMHNNLKAAADKDYQSALGGSDAINAQSQAARTHEDLLNEIDAVGEIVKRKADVAGVAKADILNQGDNFRAPQIAQMNRLKEVKAGVGDEIIGEGPAMMPTIFHDFAQKSGVGPSRVGKLLEDPKGYSEVAHNATNASVVEEVAGVTNPDKGLFGIYDPTKDPTKVGGIFGTMAGTSASGVLGSIGVGATVGGVGAYMTGGEFSEGAAAGGIMGLGLRGISGAINANAMGIQRGMYKNILGDAYDPKMNQEAMSNALRGVDKESLNIGQKGMYSVLANPNKSSVGFSLRAQTLTGGFLAGSMFSSRRSDKRRGFNAHRGNRI